MVDANGYGMNWDGLYDPEVIEYYGNRWRQDGSQFSQTVQLVLLAAGHANRRYRGKHYAMARNLVPQLRAGYDEALSRFDVLVMPTTPLQATVIPAADAPREEVIARALEMLANTAPLDVSGHPACNVPAGVVNGLPTGMMIMGKHFDDATVLRVAQTFEHAVGGFPAPQASAVGSPA
jgi:amidase